MAHDVSKAALALHKKLAGKVGTEVRASLKNKNDLALIYTPGVAAVCSAIAAKKIDVRDYTGKGKTVAIVSDGSAVLGLGNLGPEAALPVMEGKAALFKKLAGIDAVPLVLSTQDPQEIIDTVLRIAPGFGGINLEDIASPQCFEIEAVLRARLNIPVVHDDQHGTAVAVGAGLINAAKVVGKKLERMKVVVMGAGAAGNAVVQLLKQLQVWDILVVDSKGIISKTRTGLTEHKVQLAATTNHNDVEGSLEEALTDADAVIGLSGGGKLTQEHIKMMKPKPIVFALANPTPEILPIDAKKAGAAVVATGRSDYPNQINNALVFPGLFKALLKNKVVQVTNEHLLKAAIALSKVVGKPTAAKIVPDIFDPKVVEALVKAVR
jgi:malate dehydrogenase (oxaloacetate-decarboxylating)